MRAGSTSRSRPRALTVVAAAAALVAVLAAGQPEPARTEAEVGPTTLSADESPEPTAPVADPLAAALGSDPATPTTPTPTPSPTAAPDPLAQAAARASAVTAAAEWASFTLIDRTAGRSIGDRRRREVTNTESTVKAWLAADLLHTRDGDVDGWERTLLDRMVRVSDDDAAEVIWRILGANRSVERMITTCGMTDTRVYPARWSLTQISSQDLARLGACILPGPGRYLSGRAGTELLRLMRTVDPSNAFGIQEAQPAGPGVRIAVKNGWTEHGGTGLWNVNCLAMWGKDLRYVLAVTTRYPIALGLDHGAAICRQVTTALFP